MNTPNVIKAVTDHAAKDAESADAQLDQMAGEFAAACLEYGELIGLGKFSRAVAKVRSQRVEIGKTTAGEAHTPPAAEAAAHRAKGAT